MYQFLTPSTTTEAVEFLKEKSNLRILAGGTDLIIALKDRTVTCDHLMDIKKIPDLHSINVTDAGLEIGAAVTFNEILDSGLLVDWYEAIAHSASSVANILLRNRATLVGNICHASPGGDTAPSLLVTNAYVKTIAPEDVVPGGGRQVSIRDFFVGVRKHVLKPSEMVTKVIVPKVDGVSAFRKKKRIRGHDLAQVSVAISYAKDGNLDIAFGSAAPTPLLIKLGSYQVTELKSQKNKIIEEAVKSASPISDVRSTKEYRVAMLKHMTGEILDEIIEKISEKVRV